MPLTIPSSPSTIDNNNDSNPNVHVNKGNNWILLEESNPPHSDNNDKDMITTPIPNLDFTIEASRIVPLVKHEIDTIKHEIDNIISSIPRNQRTFANTIEIMSHKEIESFTRLSAIRFLQYVSDDPLVRQASVEASILLDEYFIERSTRRDIYELVKDVARVSCPEILLSLSMSLESKETDTSLISLPLERLETLKITSDHSMSLSSHSSIPSHSSTIASSTSLSHSSPLPLTEEQKRLIKKTLIGFKRNGLELPSDAHLQEYKTKQKRLAQLAIEFSQTMNEDQTKLVFTEKELEGCSPDFLASLSKMKEGEKGEETQQQQSSSPMQSPSSPSPSKNVNQSRNNDTVKNGKGITKYIVTMSYPDVFGILRRAINQDTRRQVDIAFNSRCSSNIARLEEAIQIRRECAQLLGYKNHASYQLEERLAKSPEIVNQFEHDLMIKLKPLGERELTTLKSLKNSMLTMTMAEMKSAINNKSLFSCPSTSVSTFATSTNCPLLLSSNHYCECKECKEHEECKECKKEKQCKCIKANKNPNGKEEKEKEKEKEASFNTWDLGFYSRILEEMQCSIDEDLVRQYFPLDHVISEMLSIYQQVLGLKFTPTMTIPKWHSSVQSFQVQDAKSKETIGFFYLDLFPRDGKYTHAACFPIHEGYQKRMIKKDGKENRGNREKGTEGEKGEIKRRNKKGRKRRNKKGRKGEIKRGEESLITTTTTTTIINNDNDNNHIGNRQLPISAIVANFTRPITTKSSSTLPASSTSTSSVTTTTRSDNDTIAINDNNNVSNASDNNDSSDNNASDGNHEIINNIPSLLKHSEVIVLFHELGHAMHSMCSRVQYSMFHGTSVETDFVEAPSQMLENWCWEPKVLERLGKHYKTGQMMPQSLINNLIKTRKFLPGLSYLRQIMFGILDMTIHSIETNDLPDNDKTINSLYARLSKQIRLIEQDSRVHPASSFGHLMGGYDAGYYGYLWSEVFSADMYATRFMKDPMNSDAGSSYRHEILEPGGSRDGMDSLKKFLGREPLPDAFYKSIGL